MAPKNTVQLATRVSPENYDAFDLLARADHRSKSDVLRELVEGYIKEFDKKVPRTG